MTRRIIALLLLITVWTVGLPAPAHASAPYSPHMIISDEDFFDVHSMTLDQIQTFLERKGSSLARYTVKGNDDITRTAAQVIRDAATRSGISPKVLLVLLQKEQSLIENPSPSQYAIDWATGYARCDSCSAYDPRVIPYKGFAMQVEKAAYRSKDYTLYPHLFTFRPYKTVIVDGVPVTPANAATAALYNYTPHIAGNYSFWRLWQRYFAKTLPDGMVVQVKDTPTIYLIQQGARRPFSSIGAFLSRYSLSQIVKVSASDLATYPDGTPIRYPQYSLLRSPKGAVFLLVDDKKYGITSQAVFRGLGYNPAEVVNASDRDLDEIPTAGLISRVDATPIGELVQDPRSGGVWYVQAGIKHAILDRGTMDMAFPYRPITKIDPAKLDATPRGEPVRAPDGSLVMIPESTTVWLISNGQKRPILSEDTFFSLGFSQASIRLISPATLTLHPEGAPLDIAQEVGEDDDFPAPLLISGIPAQ